MVGNLRYASTYPSQRAAAVTKVHKGGVVLWQNVITGILSLLLWTFSLITFVCLGICFVCLSFLLPPRWLHPVARAVSRGILFTAGQRLKQTGTFPDHKDGPYIYMFNHTSLLDTFVVMALIPEFTGAIGKAEQFSIPIWGWILKRWGAVPIERGHLSTAIDQLSQVEDALRNGTSLLISPEGTRSADGRLRAFKKGPFHVALNSKATIVPMALVGVFHAKRKGSWRISPNTIDVRVASPITIEGVHEWDLESLQAETCARIAALLPASQQPQPSSDTSRQESRANSGNRR